MAVGLLFLWMFVVCRGIMWGKSGGVVVFLHKKLVDSRKMLTFAFYSLIVLARVQHGKDVARGILIN